MTPPGGRDRDAILLRRRRLFTVALAGIASSGCDDAPTSPRVCLKVDSGSSAAPSVCLSPVQPKEPPDAGAPPDVDGGPEPSPTSSVPAAPSSAPVAPQPRPPRPNVCLRFPRKEDG